MEMPWFWDITLKLALVPSVGTKTFDGPLIITVARSKNSLLASLFCRKFFRQWHALNVTTMQQNITLTVTSKTHKAF